MGELSPCARSSPAARLKPRNRAVAHIVAARDLAHRLARVAAADGLALLMVGELRLAAHANAAFFGAGAALAGAGADQLTFELSQPPKTVSIKRP